MPKAVTVKREIKTAYSAVNSSHKVRVHISDPTLLEIDYFQGGLYSPWGHCPKGMTWKIKKEQGYLGIVYQVAEAVYVK